MNMQLRPPAMGYWYWTTPKGSATDHVGRRYLGSVGKVDNGIVGVTTLWANEQHYYPLHVLPDAPADRFEKGKKDPAFHTKPQLALTLIESAVAAGVAFKAEVVDAFYGDHIGLAHVLMQRGLPYVLSHSGQKSQGWARAELAHSFKDAAEDTPLREWHVITRGFREGHCERWWATELTLFGYGPNKPVRAICATTDRHTLPEKATWYLTTNLRSEQASLAEVIRLYGLWIWVEDSYKQMKDELGWADFMVRSDQAIRRHWALVCCAFAFCWWHDAYRARLVDVKTEITPTSAPEKPPRGRRKIQQRPSSPNYPRWPKALRAVRAWLAPIHWLTRYWQAFLNRPHQTHSCNLLAHLKAAVA